MSALAPQYLPRGLATSEWETPVGNRTVEEHARERLIGYGDSHGAKLVD